MSDPFHDDPLYGHPWQSPEQHEAKRRARHTLWLDRLTDRDWRRIEALADQVRDGFSPARLDDLDAPGIAVGVTSTDGLGGTSGERIGTLRNGEVAVLVWLK